MVRGVCAGVRCEGAESKHKISRKRLDKVKIEKVLSALALLGLAPAPPQAPSFPIRYPHCLD